MTQFVRIDNDNFCGVDYPELALAAAYVLPGTWNGFAMPAATAAEFRRFIAAWRSNDPNGMWHGEIFEADGALIYRDADEDIEDVFTVCGMVDGVPVYDLSGWVWHRDNDMETRS